MALVKNVFSRQVQRGSPWTRSQQAFDQLIARSQRQSQAVSDLHLHPRHIRHARDPMVVSCKQWERLGRRIEFFVNPLDMNWNFPRRGTAVKTLGGVVRNVWRNRLRQAARGGTYYDEGTVAITFQTGNIMPSAAYQDDAELQTLDDIAVAVANPRVPPGLQDLYDFFELLDTPALWGATENRHTIRHHSRAFPNLYMEGFFTEDSFNLSEVATDGNRVQWTATFQIYRMSPWIGKSSLLRRSYEQFITESGRTEQLGQENMNRYLFGEGISSLPGSLPTGQPKGQTKQVTRIASSQAKRQDISAEGSAFSSTVGEATPGGFFGF